MVQSQLVALAQQTVRSRDLLLRLVNPNLIGLLSVWLLRLDSISAALRALIFLSHLV
jgi:hypothetical protein